jgi:SAM-dependent methyltransferase
VEDPAGFKAVDAVAGDYFVRFLDARREIAGELDTKAVIAGLLNVAPGMSVLDVGSGTGDDIRAIAEVVGADGRAVGVDLSTAMVDEARSRAAGTPVEFLQGDAGKLTFEDATFDRTRAERVLMAMPEPENAVREMVRVTRPGGVVVISEMDAGTIFINSSDKELVRRLVRGFTDDLPTPDAGRRLQRMLMAAGLEDVRLVTTVIQNSVAFMRLLFAGRLGKIAGELEANAFWDELEQGEREGWLCSGGVNFTVAGRKP